MEKSDQKEHIEAGENGVVSPGNPSPPPLPTRPVDIPREGKATADAATTETEMSGSPPTKDDWEKVEAQGVEDGVEEGLTRPDESLENFEDALEMKPRGGGTVHDIHEPDEGAMEGYGVGGSAEDTAAGEASPSRQTRNFGNLSAVAGEMSAIAAGLASVRLPMGYNRHAQLGGVPGGGLVDSEGEEEFHDAHDSSPGMVKDAAKAREMKEIGNQHYKNREFEDAIDYYTMALHYCPEEEENKKDRAVYLANRAQGHLQLEEYETVVDDCTAALELDPSYVKALLRRAQANEHLEKYDMALEDAKALLEIDPGLRSAKESVPRLEKLQDDKNEKMKAEAIGKLKELGNSILGNFGLSTDNFKVNQDPNTGSYSINFER